MKNPVKIQLFVFALFLQGFSGHAVAQSAETNKSPLVGTVWRIIQVHGQQDASGRLMYFRKDFSFEGQTADSGLYNSGKYTVIDPHTFLTVHDGAQSANLYHFSIQNDTLRFSGYFLDPYFPKGERKIGFESIDEVWVKAGDLTAESQGIKFATDSTFAGALAHATREGKLIFMDCYTTWCGPCKYLSRSIFTRKEVGDFYNEKFLNLSFDMETPEGRLIQAKYGVRAYPTLLFLNPKGELEHMGIGAGDVNYLLNLGKNALDSTQNLRALKLKMKKGDRSAETLLKYFSANNYAADKQTLLNQYFKGKSLKQRLDSNSWKLFRFFESDTQSPQFAYFAGHRADFEKKFGKIEVRNKILDLLNDTRYDSVKYNVLKAVDPELFTTHKKYQDYQFALFKAKSNNSDKAGWDNLLKAAKNYLASPDIDAYEYNNMSWYIYENYKTYSDTEALKQAGMWSEKSLSIKPDENMYHDTYAHILFDLGKVQEAINQEEIALKQGLEVKSRQVKYYTEELEKFKMGLK